MKHLNSPYLSVECGGYDQNFSYLLGDPETKGLYLIDASLETAALQAQISVAQQQGYGSLQAVLLTHAHYDHLLGLPGLISANPKLPIYAHPLEESSIRQVGVEAELTPLFDGQGLTFGELVLTVHHLPGHKPGAVCFEWSTERRLFTGDTLFIGACGRTDLPGGSQAELYQSLRQLSTLDPDLLIHPGHDYGPVPARQLAQERKYNPYLRTVAAIEAGELTMSSWSALRG